MGDYKIKTFKKFELLMEAFDDLKLAVARFDELIRSPEYDAVYVYHIGDDWKPAMVMVYSEAYDAPDYGQVDPLGYL